MALLGSGTTRAEVDAVVGDPATPPGSRPIAVESFSPTGTTKDVRQVSVRFSAGVVALGDPRLPDPFDLDCSGGSDLPKGHGRWADDRNWEYDFAADLPAGVVCRFRLKAGLASAAGTAVSDPREFRFDSGGPAVVHALPNEGASNIDERQVFILKTDGDVDLASVATHARCLADGLAEQIPVKVLAAKERADALANARKLGYQAFDILWKDGRESTALVRDLRMETAPSRIVVLRCQRQLPAATALRLRWGAGIASSSGVATTSDQDLAYQTRPLFSAELTCTRTAPRAGCLPMKSIDLRFSAPVPRALALGVTFTGPDGKAIAATSADNAAVAMLEGIQFPGPFIPDSEGTISLPEGFHDDAGRSLANAARYPLKVRVDPEPPLAKFPGTFGILELKQGGVLPVSVRNLASGKDAARAQIPVRILQVANEPTTIARWIDRVDAADQPTGDGVRDATGYHWHNTTGTQPVLESITPTTALSLSAPAGTQPMELIGIPLTRPGFYVVELSSRRLGRSLLGEDTPRYVSTAVLVTDLVVHFKWGRESSLVWVTRLSDGSVVADAEVRVEAYCGAGNAPLWQGRSDRDGIARIGAVLGEPDAGRSCLYSHPLVASASKDGDFSMTPSFWHDGIGVWDFAMPRGTEEQSEVYTTVLDRGLFHPGETVSMKHVLRRRTGQGFDFLTDLAVEHDIEIRHLGSDQVYALKAAIDEHGLGESSFAIPADAKLGEYSVNFGKRRERSIESARFRVEQFRLPSMRGTLDGPRTAQVNPVAVAFDAHVAYLSGGSAGGLAVKLRSTIEREDRRFPDYPNYRFDGKRPQPGLTREDVVDELDGMDEGDGDTGAGRANASAGSKVRVQEATLDGNGVTRILVDHLPKLAGPGYLAAELEYADANGEILTTSRRVRLTPAALALGISVDGWLSKPDLVKLRVVVLDPEGKPVAGQAVAVQVYQQTRYGSRKRMIGGFYAYESLTDTRLLPVTCNGRSNAQGLVFCDLAPGVSGNLLLYAEATDAGGNRAGALDSTWILGDEFAWYGGNNSDRMDVIPEKLAYEAGEHASLQVRMPFRRATALVTSEREGVLDAYVTTLEAGRPLLDLPITPAYAPNVMVSVLAVRGRVAHAEHRPKGVAADAEITALVDLNKPAFRMGMTNLKVGWAPHRLDVKVQPTQAEFAVRGHATVKIHVSRADGGALPAGAEVALAAVDEALLLLKDNDSWHLLDHMMGVRGNEVQTATAQMQVIGKRHYGRKAVPPGGGGGREAGRARERFDSLLSWRGRVPLDEHGDATVEIPLNDSLSAFRIVAVAEAGAGYFGEGSAVIRTVQDLILVSGLPPLVREGDRFAATVTVRNTSPKPLRIDIAASAGTQALATQVLELEAGGARDVVWQVAVPYNVAELAWDIRANAGGTTGDRLKLSQQVIQAVPVRTYQATIAQLDAPLSLLLERPAGSIPGRGGIEISLFDHLGGQLDGVREYMSLYPYSCIEQNLSKSLVLDDRAMWDAWMARLPNYLDHDGLLRYFPSERIEGDDSLTAYVLTIAAERGWEIPVHSRDTMLTALDGFVAGRVVRYSALPSADLAVRKLAAIDALAHYGKAEPRMTDSIRIEPNLLPSSALLDWIDLLKRLPEISDAQARRATALGLLRARLNFQGTIMTLSGEQRDALWWLMISADSNANRLLLTVLDEPQWRADVPRLVRGALARQTRGHWNTTVANAWGVVAMAKFAAAFESEPVAGSTHVAYGREQRDAAWPAAASAPLSLPWVEGKSSLSATQLGTGAPWIMLRTTAALPLVEPLTTGLKLTRRVEAIERRSPDHWSRGDVLRVHLDLSAQADATWVVVDDPIPAGAAILGSGLGGSSDLLARDNTTTGYVWLAYEERRFDAYRAYYRFVPKGDWSIEYTVRLNNPGEFVLPASRIEAMYAPEMFGETPNPVMTVEASTP